MNGFVRHIKRLVLALVVLMFSFSAHAQSAANELSGCLQSGNAACLSNHIGSAIAMTLDNNRSTYSRVQADMVLRNFFKKNNPKSFKAAKSSDSHLIGMLNTDKGVYRVYISMNATRNGYALQEIRIER